MNTSSIPGPCPTRSLIVLLALIFADAASVRGQGEHDDVVKALDFTRSPDGRLGITVPTREQNTERLPDKNRLNKLVEIATGRVLAVIDADTGNEHMNHGDAYVDWARDGSGVFWHVSGKWGPRTMNYLRVSKDRVIWQANLTTASQQEILRRVRQAAPQTYAAAVRRNHGQEHPCKGFTMDVELDQKTDYQLPLRFYVGLTSEPRGFGPLSVPVEASVVARMVGVLQKDGCIEWSEFKMLTRRQALRRESFLEGGKSQEPELTQAIRQRIGATSPAAMKIIASYNEDDPEVSPLLRLERSWIDHMPFSLGGKFLILATTDSKSYPNYPVEGEALVALPGVFGEDGMVKWSEAKVVTGKQASKQMETVRQLKFYELVKLEVMQRLAADAPKTLEAFQRAEADSIASLPEDVRRRSVNDDGLLFLSEGFESGGACCLPHPAQLPCPFKTKVRPAKRGIEAQDWPIEAEFHATIVGVINEDGSITWRRVSLLTGAEARLVP